MTAEKQAAEAPMTKYRLMSNRLGILASAFRSDNSPKELPTYFLLMDSQGCLVELEGKHDSLSEQLDHARDTIGSLARQAKALVEERGKVEDALRQCERQLKEVSEISHRYRNQYDSLLEQVGRGKSGVEVIEAGAGTPVDLRVPVETLWEVQELVAMLGKRLDGISGPRR